MAHFNMFLTQEEINDIIARKNVEPWRTAYNKFINTHLPIAISTQLQSVTYRGKTIPGYDNHDYYTEFIYCGWATCGPPASGIGNKCCDGQNNPNANLIDQAAIAKMSISVRDLALAYRLTGNMSYANKAVQLIDTWAINTGTYMRPRFTKNPGRTFGQSGIDIAIYGQPLFYGADLLGNYAGWINRPAFITWCKNLLDDVNNVTWPSQWHPDKVAFMAGAAVLTDNDAKVQSVFNEWKAMVVEQIDSRGRMIKAISRTNSFDYSIVTLKNMIYVAEIARHYNQNNVDLWHYKSGSIGLELALDFHAPYLINPSNWPYSQTNSINVWSHKSMYELAHRTFNKYGNILTGRPYRDSRTLGAVTLTHGI